MSYIKGWMVKSNLVISLVLYLNSGTLILLLFWWPDSGSLFFNIVFTKSHDGIELLGNTLSAKKKTFQVDFYEDWSLLCARAPTKAWMEEEFWSGTVFCYHNCSDLLWEKFVLVSGYWGQEKWVEKKFCKFEARPWICNVFEIHFSWSQHPGKIQNYTRQIIQTVKG